ncbi:sialidase family protein [Enterococcus sp. AZ163]|uniref:sialidase family protein n=1 Tax=Enterococcus sp. AZ163 TaxID=2774638 RepID=UPI003D287A9A
MNKKKSDYSSKGRSGKSWGSFLRTIPFTIRVVILTVLIGLSLVSYNIGRAVSGAKAEADLHASNEKHPVTSEDVKVRRNNGKWEFSSDDGVSWTRTPPEDIYEDKDGRLRYKNSLSKTITKDPEDDVFKFPFDDKNGKGIVMKQEDGKWKFSSDGGKTWTEEVPEGVEVDKDGTLTWKSEDGNKLSEFNSEENSWKYSEDGGKTWSDPLKDVEDWLKNGFTVPVEGGVSMKFQDGKIFYSTDGGKTWSEEVPEGFSDKVKSVITKQTEDDKTLYSTDGGKTWSEEKPEGFEIPNIDDILDSIPDELLPKEGKDDFSKGQVTSV